MKGEWNCFHCLKPGHTIIDCHTVSNAESYENTTLVCKFKDHHPLTLPRIYCYN